MTETPYSVIPFDSKEYDFIKIIGDIFGLYDLENIHELSNEVYKEQFKVGMDSSTIFHTMFYDKFRAGWDELTSLYERFIKEVVSNQYQEDFLYQSFVTFRVHLPGNIAVGAFHNDAEFNHPKGEINYIIPLTNSNKTASVWVESEPGKKDFRDMVLIIGGLIKFNGNELTHGNKTNETNKSRVSMDFRILPLSKYDESNEGESITRNTKFKEGAYYKRFTHG